MIDICITIDTEFSIAGAFTSPAERRPIGEINVTCPAAGREQGLGFLLETFEKFGILATFFVEALQVCHFGDAPMRGVVERILAARQDVQLHLHPCWLLFRDPDWSGHLTSDRPGDRCDGCSDQELDDMLTVGLDALRRMGVPDPIALRTGSLRVDREVYRAMSRFGLRIASNIGLAAFRPKDPALALTGGRHRIDGVIELPVLTYRQPPIGGRPLGLLSITGTSWLETRSLLRRASEAGTRTIVVLTHPFEFIKGDRLHPHTWQPNRVNQNRLTRLCDFISRNPHEFRAVSISSAAPRWVAEPEERAPDLAVPAPLAFLRMAENRANDLIRII